MIWIEDKYFCLASYLFDGVKQVMLQPIVYNFRCPFCGDSQKSKRKKRAYVYERDNNLLFYCHNCGASMRLTTLLQELAPAVYASYKMEMLQSKSKPKPPDPGFGKNKPTFHKRKLSLQTTLDRCDANNTILQYAKQRQIPERMYSSIHVCNNLTRITSQIERYHDLQFTYKAMVIPFYDKNRDFSYLVCRILDSQAKTRYYTFEIDDQLPKLWGVEFVDWKQPIWVLEGAIDAMCIPNALALGGSVNIQALDYINLHINNKSDVTFVYDNEIFSNKQIFSQVKQRIKDGYNVVLYDRNFVSKDINDAIINGMAETEILSYLKSRTFSGLNATLELARLSKPKNR